MPGTLARTCTVAYRALRPQCSRPAGCPRFSPGARVAFAHRAAANPLIPHSLHSKFRRGSPPQSRRSVAPPPPQKELSLSLPPARKTHSKHRWQNPRNPVPRTLCFRRPHPYRPTRKQRLAPAPSRLPPERPQPAPPNSRGTPPPSDTGSPQIAPTRPQTTYSDTHHRAPQSSPAALPPDHPRLAPPPFERPSQPASPAATKSPGPNRCLRQPESISAKFLGYRNETPYPGSEYFANAESRARVC